eukprot:1250564-Ditylum_brightwellii.AAC.1
MKGKVGVPIASDDSATGNAVGVTDSAIHGDTVELELGYNNMDGAIDTVGTIEHIDGAEDTDGAKLARSAGIINDCAGIDHNIDMVGVLLGFTNEVGQ